MYIVLVCRVPVRTRNLLIRSQKNRLGPFLFPFPELVQFSVLYNSATPLSSPSLPYFHRPHYVSTLILDRLRPLAKIERTRGDLGGRRQGRDYKNEEAHRTLLSPQYPLVISLHIRPPPPQLCNEKNPLVLCHFL